MDYEYLENTAQMVGALQRELGYALENGQKISHIDVSEDGEVIESIEVNFE